MKKIIFIGKNSCGKTSLCQLMKGEEVRDKKTQTIEIYEDIIDTPGQYIEDICYYGALIITAAEVEIIALVQEYGDMFGKIPPAFGATFGRKVIGIITKMDKALENSKCNKNILEVEKQLILAGAEKIFKVSIFSENSIKILEEYINSNCRKNAI